jgi:hypothetical protein
MSAIDRILFRKRRGIIRLGDRDCNGWVDEMLMKGN